MSRASLRTLVVAAVILANALPSAWAADSTAQAEQIATAIEKGTIDIPAGLQQLEKVASEQAPQFAATVKSLADATNAALQRKSPCDLTTLRTRVAATIRSIWHKKSLPNPVVCDVDPDAIDVARVIAGATTSLDFHGYELPKKGIRALVEADGNGLLLDVTSSLHWNSAYHVVLSLDGSVQAALTKPEARRVTLQFKGKSLSDVGVINLKPICADEPAKTIKVDPIAIIPPSTSNDTEFFGHGPLTTWSIKVQPSPDRTRVEAEVHFEALERIFMTVAQVNALIAYYLAPTPQFPGGISPNEANRLRQLLGEAAARGQGEGLYFVAGDDSQMIRTQTFPLWTAPAGSAVMEVLGATAPVVGRHFFQDSERDHSVAENPGAPIASLELWGDRNGDDLSYSRMKVTFGALTLHMHQTQDCRDVR